MNTRWEAMQDIFWAARELPLAEREAYVATACAGDPALLADVRAMLAADAQQGILDRASVVLDPTGDPMAQPRVDRVGPYVVTGEIGRGGMGVVYRAYDPRLRRELALKFLHASASHEAGAKSRFMEEARAASALDHPHTCPVYDIGTAEDGHLFIAMAYCGGGSLAERLAAGPLSVDAAVRIAVQVGEALDAAHEAGILHRDVKPANIAFTERGEARVLDFGIAILGAHEWASPRTGAGTPSYMAPEQLRGGAVDRRTDVWALCVVLHEMLTGRKPFVGADRASLEAAILEGEPADLRLERPEVPPALAAIVRRGLEKDPANRFPTGAELVAALRNLTSGVPAAPSRRRTRLRVAAALMVVTVAVAGAVLYRSTLGSEEAAPLDRAAVVVVPFRVSGEPSLSYLREGMVDLLAAKLTGEGGLRAVDPRTVFDAWRRMSGVEGDATPDATASLARRLGAGNVLLGEVVGTSANLVVNATVLNARGAVVSRASAEGAHDDLSGLVDHLVARILTLSAGEEPQRLAALTSTSLPALKAYLEGQTAYRSGRYAEALEKYGLALDLDSTFALAGLGLHAADGWVGTGHARERGDAAAWRWRHRLSDRDRAILEAALGTAYPRPPTTREQLEAVERALRLAPDHAELWYELGDQYLHYGRILGADDWESQAERGFRRALELDSTFSAPINHLVALYARQGRTAELRALTRAELSREPVGPSADYLRLHEAIARRLPLPQREAELDSLATETLAWIGMNTQDEGVAVALGTASIAVRGGRPGTREERLERRLAMHAVALNGGRPTTATALTETMRDLQPDSSFMLRLRVLSALYGDGDRGAAQGAVSALLGRRAADGPMRRLNRCVVDLWRVEAGPIAGAPRRSVPGPAERPAGRDSIAQVVCHAVLQAALAAARNDGTEEAAMTRVDDLIRSGPVEFYRGDGHAEYAPIVLARLRERSGDRAGALVALRRRPYFIGWQPFLAATLLDEARLAAEVGDRAGALRAYEHYLALRADPEPSMRAVAESARAELARLR